MSDMMDEQSLLRLVYSAVKRHPSIAPKLMEFSRWAIEQRLREAQEQIADTEAALVLELMHKGRRGRRLMKPESVEKLRKWDGRHAMRWSEMELKT